ncbi:hypothetical protein L3Y34_009794 [Caenorhabditis briggsae]|uniref:G-protein coupled receptors family 1 profile domain-containing protein n=1 Tax=Caenorhabditis briggsae TaxID=6238 RepID=A0AAE9A6H3_CAEBR|nr:hypothetical protein L3Y34_009794 [Caenorhabditis briggsae]
MMVICGSDLVQLVALLPNDAKYIVTVSVPGFCTDINPFFKSLLTLIHSFANGFTIFVSSWMAVLMAFFRSLSIKFAMSSFSEYFSKTSTAHKMATTVLSIGFFYNLLSFFLRYSTIRLNEPCDLISRISDPNNEEYFLSGSREANHISIMITFFDGVFQLFQMIIFTYSTVFLARFIRETSRNKVMRSRESRETERTEGLILFTLVPFFIFIFPMMISNFTIPILSNFAVIPHALRMSVRILTMLQTINASSHCIVCIFMSSQYRSAAKIEFGSAQKMRQDTGNAPMDEKCVEALGMRQDTKHALGHQKWVKARERTFYNSPKWNIAIWMWIYGAMFN